MRWAGPAAIAAAARARRGTMASEGMKLVLITRGRRTGSQFYNGSVTHCQPCSSSQTGRTTMASAVWDSSAMILISWR